MIKLLIIPSRIADQAATGCTSAAPARRRALCHMRRTLSQTRQIAPTQEQESDR